MQRSTDRILTTHTGSLPRPDELEEAMLETLAGRKHSDPDRVKALVREATAGVVRKQAEAGVDVVNDGEYGKPSYSTYVTDRLSGFGGESDPLVVTDFADYPGSERTLLNDPAYTQMARPACVEPVTRRDDADAAVQTDIALLKGALEGVDVVGAFMTAVSPATISMFMQNKHYPDAESYVSALADVMRPEYQAVIDAGLDLQIDAPDLGCGHVLYPGADHAEVKRNLAMHIEALNAALDGLPSDRMRMHVCWGNYEGPHHYDIEFKEIVDIVLRARPDGLVVEGANPRHEHEWQVWEDVPLPDGKILMPGVIDSTNNYIEHPELIAQRLVRYAKVVGRENVLGASDCGFATMVGMRGTAPSVAWGKLESLSAGARLATEQLW